MKHVARGRYVAGCEQAHAENYQKMAGIFLLAVAAPLSPPPEWDPQGGYCVVGPAGCGTGKSGVSRLPHG